LLGPLLWLLKYFPHLGKQLAILLKLQLFMQNRILTSNFLLNDIFRRMQWSYHCPTGTEIIFSLYRFKEKWFKRFVIHLALSIILGGPAKGLRPLWQRPRRLHHVQGAEEGHEEEQDEPDQGRDQGSILQDSLFGWKLFGEFFVSKFCTIFHPKMTDTNLSEF
jgi:hypothetical protein